jgi:GR25 family glycosyltransferase involved in LPS biosynthesis
MINEFFDKVYLINLPSATDRLSAATENCAKVGIEFEVVEAISGDNEKVVMNSKGHVGWNMNAAALGLTTLNIIKDAKEKGYKNIFIMEDDVDFINFNFNEILAKALRGLPNDWDFFHLNVANEYPAKWVSTCLVRLGGAWCCQAYGVNSTMYDRYITELEKCIMPIDEVTLKLHKLRKKSYATSPCIVIHHEGNYSTLREQEVDY